MSIEQFLRGVEERVLSLPEAQRGQVLDRLQLARQFIGTQDPLEIFNSWKTPGERYMPLAKRKILNLSRQRTTKSPRGRKAIPAGDA